MTSPTARHAPGVPVYANRFSVSVSPAGVMIAFYSNAPTPPDGVPEPISVGTVFLSVADATLLGQVIPQTLAAHALARAPGMTEQ